MRTLLPLLLAVLFGAPGFAWGQSLAAVAEKEEARRKKVKQSSRVYTNKDVGPADRSAPPPAPAPAAAGEAGAVPPAAGQGQAPAGETEDAAASEEGTDEEQGAQDEQQWRARITEARAALERNQMFAEALQSRINSLWMDFTARDDPAQRAVIDADRKKAIAQLDRVKSEIVSQTKAIADIEEEARRAGVPPGWLR